MTDPLEYTVEDNLKLMELLMNFHRAPTGESNAAFMQELRHGNAWVIILIERPITSATRELSPEDLVLITLEDGTPILGVHAFLTSIHAVELKDRMNLHLVRSADFIRACDAKGIMVIILDPGQPYETGIGRNGGKHVPFSAMEPALWKGAMHPDPTTTLSSREERKARMRRSQA